MKTIRIELHEKMVNLNSDFFTPQIFEYISELTENERNNLQILSSLEREEIINWITVKGMEYSRTLLSKLTDRALSVIYFVVLDGRKFADKTYSQLTYGG